MGRVKARSIEPQMVGDAVGAIQGRAKGDLLGGSLIVVTGTTSGRFQVEAASNQSIRCSSGLLYSIYRPALSGEMCTGRIIQVLPYAGDKKVKDGDALWLGRDGAWSLTKPKTRAIQVGRIIGSGDSAQVLLAPQGQY
mgnify:CR=1 FL=1